MIVSTKHLMILAMMMVMTISARSATTGFTAHTMLTCTSPQLLTMLQQCTILHLLHITQRHL